MIKITVQTINKWAASLVIASLIFVSCNQEANVEVMDPNVEASFDAELKQVLEIMDDTPHMAIDQLNVLIADAESIKSKYYTSKAKWYKGYIYARIIEDVSQAYISYKDALDDVLQTDDSSLKMTIYNNLGILYRYYSQYDAAIANYESALELKNDLTAKQLSKLYYNYGVALKLKDDSVSFLEAEQAFTKSLEYAEQIDYHVNIADVHNQIGLMYKKIQNYEMARIAYGNTIKTYMSNPEMLEAVGRSYHAIGVTYMDEGNFDAAIPAFEKALELKKVSGSIFVTKYDLGTVYLRKGDFEKAIETWKDALGEKHDKNNIEQVQIYADLTKALKSNNEFEEALGFSEVYNSSIQNILEKGEEYKSKSDQVLFANVIKEYDEFNEPTSFFAQTPVIIVSIILSVGIIYLLVMLYYKSQSKRKVTEVVSKIQTEFMDIKVD